MKISASFLSIRQDLKTNIQRLCHTDIDYLHLDIMDGQFVLNKTWCKEELEPILDDTKPLDIHLMVEDVYAYIDEFASFHPVYLTFHYETLDVLEKIAYIHSKGCLAGVSIKPQTDVTLLQPYLPFLDLVLVMSVEPGYGGQSFLENSVSKIEWLYQMRKENGYSYVIEVDGGINDKTISKVAKADIAVVGSFITNGNYEENVQKLK